MRIDGTLPQQLLQVLSKSAMIEGLNIGDLIQAKVISLKDGMLLMKMMDGSSLTASISDNSNIPEGALLTLQIGEPVNGQLTAKIVNPETQQKQSPSPQNLPAQAGARLQAFGEKATDALVSKVLNLIAENPSLGLDKAAFLVANRMDPDKGMQDIIMKLAQKEFRIDSNLTALKDQLVAALANSDDHSLDSLFKPLLANQKIERAVSSLADKLTSLIYQTGSEGTYANQAVQTDSPRQAVQTGTDQINQMSQTNRVAQGQPDNLSQLLAKNILEALEKAGSSNKPIDRETAISLVKAAIENNIGGSNPGSSKVNMKLPEKNLDDIISGFIKDISDAQGKAEALQKPDPATIKHLVDKVFEKAFIKADNGITAPIDINDKVKALKDVIQFTNDALKQVDSKSAQTVTPVVHELQNALQFFNQANTYHAFVQVPLLINNHQTTGELFIMKRQSKRGKIDPNQFTLFISLNTQNLGLVETFLNATNRCVTANFRVGDEGLSGFVKAHYKELYQALQKKGYTLVEMKCRIHADDEVNLLNVGQKTEDILGMNAKVDLKI